MVSKNAEFHADFKSVKKVLKNAHKKICKHKTSLRNMSKSEKSANFTFLRGIFQNFFNRLEISVKFGFFDTHIEFVTKNFFPSYYHFF